jgi:thioredoxin reductase (NADPH)
LRYGWKANSRKKISSFDIKGLYAAGDVVSDRHQIAVATGHAAVAATHIHKSLPNNFR